MLGGKRILLIIAGGIAAYKSLELIRRLRDRGAIVTPVMTSAAEQFVTPLSVAALAGEKLYRDLFDLTDEAEMGHIELSRSADLLLVAPATADLMAKMAHGQANDLASTVLLATDTPVLVAPAMNVRMWQHPATQRNLTLLQGDGIEFVGPDDGNMACGEFGPGRMSEPLAIVAAVEAKLTAGPLLANALLSPLAPRMNPLIQCVILRTAHQGVRATRWPQRLRRWAPRWYLSPARRRSRPQMGCRWCQLRLHSKCSKRLKVHFPQTPRCVPQRWPTGALCHLRFIR